MSSVKPVISIIVRDDGRDLAAVLASLAAPGEVGLEVIVENDTDFGAALERGFSRASGSILGCLDADDRLLPGAASGIAAAIAPERGMFAALGRAAWRVEDVSDLAVPQPGEWLGLSDHLRIWDKRFNTVPRASFFWHRSVRERVGPFIRGPAYAVDYDFTCRVGRHFAIHRVDAFWSLSRMAPEASAGPTEQEMLQACIEVSRRYWGPWWSPLRWRCALSLAAYERHWHDHARHHARRRERAVAEGRRFAAAIELAKTWLYSPAMARGRFLDR